jgi:hypothetical protein
VVKRPAIQFYPGDWQRNPKVQSCSVAARGLWFEMLCIMHGGTPYGFLKVGQRVIDPPTLARMVGCSLDECGAWLAELEEADVFSRDKNGVIYSRRMVEDEAKRKQQVKHGKRGGNPDLVKGGVKGRDNPPRARVRAADADSSMQTADEIEEEEDSTADEYPFEFLKFWQAYPRKKKKGDALKAWSQTAKQQPPLADILRKIEELKQSREWLKDGGQFISYPATWLRAHGWNDEVDRPTGPDDTSDLEAAAARHRGSTP